LSRIDSFCQFAPYPCFRIEGSERRIPCEDTTLGTVHHEHRNSAECYEIIVGFGDKRTTIMSVILL